MKILLSGYRHGDKETGCYYRLFSATMFDGRSVYGVLRDYGEDETGVPNNAVTLVCIDDGTIESYNTAYRMFMRLVDM